MTDFVKNSTLPAARCETVTPADGSDNVTFTSRGIILPTAGGLSFVNQAGATLTWTGLLAGVIYPIRTNRVRATGTTATEVYVLA